MLTSPSRAWNVVIQLCGRDRGAALASSLLGLTLWIISVLAADMSFAQGLLQSLRDDVRSASGDSAPDGGEGDEHAKNQRDKHCDGASSWSSDVEDDAETSLLVGLGKLAFLAATSPVWLPKSLIDDTSFAPGCFARYPYRCDLDGYMAPDTEFMRQQYPGLENDRYGWIVRLRGEYGGDFDNLSRAGGQLLIDTASRWGMDAEANYLREEPPAHQPDQLWLGDVNVVYRFAQSPMLQMRTGLGFNWLADDLGSDVGFNFTYSGDFFPAEPWIVSAEIDWGKLGHAGLFHGRASVGVHFHRVELYVGYDYLDVGDTQMNSAVSGVRIWY
jgi:hypothetical protein